ncbi:MAG: hypothetical protein NXI18_16680 [Alphaproteobacteria bacterium]|nr:hypothetical protein [Alphaproteobacteria bacterium]
MDRARVVVLTGVVTLLESTPTAGLSACVVRGGYHSADDPLGPLPSVDL